MNQVAKKNEFYRYNIKLPSLFMARKQKMKIILSELEKRHPCFSARCAWRAHTVRKNGHWAAEVLLSDREKLPPQIRFTEVFFCFLAIFAIVLGILAFSKKNKDSSELEVLPEIMQEQEIKRKNLTEDLNTFFDELCLQKVKLSRLSMDSKNGAGTVDFALLGAVPDFSESKDSIPMSIKKISYEKEESFCEGQLFLKDAFPGVQQAPGALSQKHFRTVLADSGAKIILENPSLAKMQIRVEYEKLSQFFTSVFEFFNEEHLFSTALDLEVQDSFILCHLNYAAAEKTDELENANKIWKILSESSELFLKKQEPKNHQPENFKKQSDFQKEKSISFGQKIGEASIAGGEKLIFYRTESGKIIGVKQ